MTLMTSAHKHVITRSCRPHGKRLHSLGAATLFLLGLGACGEGNLETPGTASGGEAGTSSGGLQGPGGVGVSGSGGVPAVAGAPASGGASSSGGLAATGGTSPGDPDVGGAQSTGGTVGNGGSSGGTQSSGGAAVGDIWGGLKNPPVKSTGCGKPATIKSATTTIMSGGIQRTYMVDVPADYDPAKPYRLFFASHGQGSTLANITQSNYYDLKNQSIAAKEPAIFVAALGYGGMPGTSGGAWGQADHALFDDITSFLEDNMCVDTTRIFAIGMSMGGMQTYSLSTTRPTKIRAGVGLAPTNFRIWLPDVKSTAPIAWMQTTGMGDTTCAFVANEAAKQGSKFIALEKAANNGCTIPAEIPTWKSGAHVCYDFEGCKPGYPVKACTFNGKHTNTNSDPGSNVNWIGVESWKFFMQF
jgi:poly(3-hydroxybutyrate) depolymerase